MESKQPHRSVSQLNKYRQCSESYRLSYVDKVYVNQPAAWLAQGTAFHKAVQEWEESGRSDLVDIGSVYALEYDNEIERMKQRQPDLKQWQHAFKISTENDIEERKSKGLIQTEAYKVFAENDSFVIADVDDYTIGVEIEFEVMIGKVLVRGAIDQIILHPDGYEVRDLKTGNREASPIQIGIYKVALEKIFDWPIVKGSFYYAKDSKVVTISQKELDRYDEAYLSELLEALETGIQHKVFIPNPGSHCTFCPVKDSCREIGSNPKKLGS